MLLKASTLGIFVFCVRCVTCCVMSDRSVVLPGTEGSVTKMPRALPQALKVKRQVNTEEEND